jgi:hypothetical protein
MPVFISHRTADDSLAKEIYNRLTQVHGINCFIDDFMPSTTPEKVTSVILENLNRCTHLMAVLTDNTEGSWWVPYEIGVAEQASRAITSYSNMGCAKLPEYLWHWPVLKGPTGIDRFAAVYHLEAFSTSQILAGGLVKESASNENFSSRGTSTSSAKSFEKSLKNALGQS